MQKKCEGCKLEFFPEDLTEHTKGERIYHFCEFCGGSFMSNSVMYPDTNVTRRQILQTIARSHNIIIQEIRNINIKK